MNAPDAKGRRRAKNSAGRQGLPGGSTGSGGSAGAWPWVAAGAGLLLAVQACTPEGEARNTLVDVPCGEPSAELSTGADAQAAFACLNAGGQLDVMAPLIDALASQPASGGGTLLDAWVGLLQDGDDQEPATATDLAENLEGLADWLESGVPSDLSLAAQGIEDGTVPAGIGLFGALSRGILSLTPDQRDALRAAVADLLCGPDPSACDSPLRRYLKGQASQRLAHDPGDPDFPFKTAEEERRKLTQLLYGLGDEARAQEADAGIARAIVRMAQSGTDAAGAPAPSLLSDIVTDLLPSLHGDDPDTLAFDGYSSRNPTRSALYGILSTAARQEVRQAMIDAHPDNYQLLTHHFVLDTLEVGAVDDGLDRCDPDAAWNGSDAVHGVGQLLRILDAANISYEDPSLPVRCGTVVGGALPYLAGMYDLTGSRNLAVITLQLFSQMPADEAQAGADLLNHPWAVDAIYAMCELPVLDDDTEATQAVVYMPSNLTYGQAYLRAVDQAGQLDRVLGYLTRLWRTGAWCDLTPMLRLYDDPTVVHPAARAVEPLLPDEGGGPLAHDTVTIHQMDVLADLGRHAGPLLPALEAALRDPQAEDLLTRMLLGTGRTAWRADSALADADEAARAAASRDPEATQVADWARRVSDRAFMELTWETLGNPAIQDALLVPGPTGRSLVDEIGRMLSDHSFDEVLEALADALRGL